jgi:hypothetical protein
MKYLTKTINQLTNFQFAKRSIRFFFQRLIRGWDDRETYSLDCSLAKIIVPRLKRFKEVSIAVPVNLEEKEWSEIIDTMIASFEFFGSEQRWNATNEEIIKHQQGLNFFAEYYNSLWW